MCRTSINAGINYLDMARRLRSLLAISLPCLLHALNGTDPGLSLNITSPGFILGSNLGSTSDDADIHVTSASPPNVLNFSLPVVTPKPGSLPTVSSM